MNLLNLFKRPRIFNRSIKTLLILLRDNMESIDYTGLCHLSGSLYHQNKITVNEHYKLLKFIKKNRPKPGSKHYDEKMRLSAYFWHIGEAQPRKAWIDDMINSR